MINHRPKTTASLESFSVLVLVAALSATSVQTCQTIGFVTIDNDNKHFGLEACRTPVKPLAVYSLSASILTLCTFCPLLGAGTLPSLSGLA